MSPEEHHYPALTTDVVLFALGQDGVSVLLVRRAQPPFQGAWAFPGGFVDTGEALLDSASRELEEETGIREVHLEQLRAFGDPQRDPRGHVVTVVYAGVVAEAVLPGARAGSDASEASWWPIDGLPSLAFDHDKILGCALRSLGLRLGCLNTEADVSWSVPDTLTVAHVRTACHAIEARVRNR